ncbi:CdaR family protein [Massilibacteroides sp.]|uniref:CdaR family protein n=1 Tax=Massilibacteroides sp. TaxID=2034766 RepID=UPI0026139D0B|nr:CdaR family protein [Massilibacteroides sp.]MDD4514310.1 YbbR-like domain-containing protein [Massilibacteroides sp.]
MNEEYEIEITIPVRYKDIPADVAFTQTPPKEIIVFVKDKGNVLLNYSIGRIIAPIEVEYKKARNKNGVLVVSQEEIESHIQKQLFNTTQLHRFSPTSIEIQTSKRKQKKVPIKFNGSVLPNDGYGISGEITIAPTMIDIFSTQNILDSISEIKTEYLEVKNVKKSISKSIALETIPGVTFGQAYVSIAIPIEEFTEKTLEIPVVCVGIPQNYSVRIFPPTVKVNCNIPLSKYKNLNEDNFTIRIKYTDLEQYVSGSIPIRLEQQPDWIQNYSLVPSKVEFIIEQAITSK